MREGSTVIPVWQPWDFISGLHETPVVVIMGLHMDDLFFWDIGGREGAGLATDLVFTVACVTLTTRNVWMLNASMHRGGRILG